METQTFSPIPESVLSEVERITGKNHHKPRRKIFILSFLTIALISTLAYAYISLKTQPPIPNFPSLSSSSDASSSNPNFNQEPNSQLFQILNFGASPTPTLEPNFRRYTNDVLGISFGHPVPQINVTQPHPQMVQATFRNTTGSYIQISSLLRNNLTDTPNFNTQNYNTLNNLQINSSVLRGSPGINLGGYYRRIKDSSLGKYDAKTFELRYSESGDEIPKVIYYIDTESRIYIITTSWQKGYLDEALFNKIINTLQLQ